MDLKDFIKRLSEDRDFEIKFKELDSVEALIKCATKEGYSITEKDIEVLRSELECVKNGCMELGDEELENVAGGFVIPVMPMGSGMGPQPGWLTNLITVFVGKSNLTASSSGNINAQKLPADVRDMATSSIPHNSNSVPSISNIPFGAVNPLDQTETAI